VSRAPLDWDAATYDRVAEPQEAWAREIIARLDLEGDELVLDAGCGSGRVTRLLLERIPRGRLIAVDGSPAMVALARETLGLGGAEAPAGASAGDARVIGVECQDLLELSLEEPVDAVFSCAVFHHIHDHERLFSRLRTALRPGGRLAAQCGGEGNIDRFRRLSDTVAARPPYVAYLGDMAPPWHYASPEVTEARLRAAGFENVRCWLEPKLTTPTDARGFTESVLLNYHLERLREKAPAERAEELGGAFTDDVLAAVGEPLVLEYVRLNIEATAGDL
jgi:trans-aconitate 2-methyltransferase